MAIFTVKFDQLIVKSTQVKILLLRIHIFPAVARRFFYAATVTIWAYHK